MLLVSYWKENDLKRKQNNKLQVKKICSWTGKVLNP